MLDEERAVLVAARAWNKARALMVKLEKAEPFNPLKPSASRELWVAYDEEHRTRKELRLAVEALEECK